MKSFYKIVVVIPVGPGVNLDFAADTIASVLFYTTDTYKIIVIDDSHQGLGNKLKIYFPFIDILNTPKPYGRLCGLYITLCEAYKYAIENYEFSTLLKLDTDALIIGANYASEAIILFEKNSLTGMAGQYGYQYNGEPWDISWPESQLKRITKTVRILKNITPNLLLRKWYFKALTNGYKTGESVFGGSYFISEKCLKTLNDLGLLPDYKFETLDLEEDHLISLLVIAAGLKLADISLGKMPLACAWRGLPAHPSQLFNEGKKIIHSTRYWQNMKEDEIRSYYKKQRTLSKA